MVSDKEIEAAAKAHYETGHNPKNPHPPRWNALNEYGKQNWRDLMKPALEAAEKVSLKFKPDWDTAILMRDLELENDKLTEENERLTTALKEQQDGK